MQGQEPRPGKEEGREQEAERRSPWTWPGRARASLLGLAVVLRTASPSTPPSTLPRRSGARQLPSQRRREGSQRCEISTSFYTPLIEPFAFCLVSEALPPHTGIAPVARRPARGGGAQSTSARARASAAQQTAQPSPRQRQTHGSHNHAPGSRDRELAIKTAHRSSGAVRKRRRTPDQGCRGDVLASSQHEADLT